MRLLKELTRFFGIITVSFAIFRDSHYDAIKCSLVLIFIVYIWPWAVAAFAKLIGLKQSSIGYDGTLYLNDDSHRITSKYTMDEVKKKNEVIFRVSTEEFKEEEE